MQRQKLILIIGVVLGIIAVLLIKVYLGQQRQYIVEQEKEKTQKMQEDLVPVLVAKKDIAKGSTVEADSLEVEMTSKQSVQPQAVTSLDRISGMTTVIPISKGEQMTLNKLVWPRDTSSSSSSAGTLAMITPVGKRAITISVDNLASLVGMIKAGDYVDVIALLAVPVLTPDNKQSSQIAITPLFQNVLVLAVGREIGRSQIAKPSLPEGGRYSKPSDEKASDNSGSSQIITLALAPQEANLIAFVQEQGKIRLTLRSPADSQVQQSLPTTWDTLFKYIIPSKETPATKPEAKEGTVKEQEEQIEYVEIYRGLSREKIPLSK